MSAALHQPATKTQLNQKLSSWVSYQNQNQTNHGSDRSELEANTCKTCRIWKSYVNISPELRLCCFARRSLASLSQHQTRTGGKIRCCFPEHHGIYHETDRKNG